MKNKTLIASLAFARNAINVSQSWIYDIADFAVRVINGGENVYKRNTGIFSTLKVNLFELGIGDKENFVSIGDKDVFNYQGTNRIGKSVQNKISALWHFLECVIVSSSRSITKDQVGLSPEMAKELVKDFNLTYDTLSTALPAFKEFLSESNTDKKVTHLKKLIANSLSNASESNKSKGKNSKGKPSKNSFAGVMQRIDATAEMVQDMNSNKTAKENLTKAISAQVKTNELTKDDLILRIANLDALRRQYQIQLTAIVDKEKESAIELAATGTDGK